MSDSITEAAVSSYLSTLLWSECFHGQGESGEDPLIVDGEEIDPGTPLDQIPGCDVSDLETLAPEIVTEAREDLEAFRTDCLNMIGIDPFKFFDAGQVAHDFALSRNGHGAGFFDREYKVSTHINGPHDPDQSNSIADELQERAREAGTLGLQVWNSYDPEGEPTGLVMESHG
jgi:hypothetical protein